ncbi:MAG: THxN family PEP-CTERM protein [Calothrix sp. MO_167.B12]|nr:THxN family PEP-CTERM protein [Calothrix sp. MO_167.B12]
MAISNLLSKKVTKKLKYIGMAATLAISIGYAESAKALIKMNTSGTWTEVTGSPYNLQGLGTDKIRWGKSTGDGKSSYTFTGLNDIDLKLDGSRFLLGEFTHNNRPITDGSITGANLALNFDIQGSDSQTLDLFFKHDETANGPNDRTERYCGEILGYKRRLCPDIVELPKTRSLDKIVIGGEKYKINLKFQRIIDGEPAIREDGTPIYTARFKTKENKSNKAKLFARLTKVKRRVPEPTAGLGLLAIGTVGTFSLKKKNKQSVEKN